MSNEHFTIRVPLPHHIVTSTMTFALRAAGEGKRFGSISNVARATFRTFVPQPATPAPCPSESVLPPSTATELKPEQTNGGTVTTPVVFSHTSTVPTWTNAGDSIKTLSIQNSTGFVTVNASVTGNPKTQPSQNRKQYEIDIIVVSAVVCCVCLAGMLAYVSCKVFLNKRLSRGCQSEIPLSTCDMPCQSDMP